MERNDINRIGSRGLPRRSFTEDFFNDPFDNFNTLPPQTRDFQRRFTERGLFDEDNDNFFDSFSSGGSGGRHIPFQHEPTFFRSSMPRRQYKPQPSNTHNKPKENSSSVERPIPIQVKQATTQKQCSPPYYNENDQIINNVHHIPIRQMNSNENQKDQKVEAKGNMPPKFDYDSHVNEINPVDKRRRFSNCQQQQNEHNYANNQNKHIPDIVIDDYGDGKVLKEQEKPAAIPLPAPAIPLPAPQQNIKLENGTEPTLEDDKMSKENKSEVTIEQDNYKDDNEATNVNIVADNNEHLIQLLDDTERKVELLRESATLLEQEKESILDMLKNIKLTGSIIKLDQGDRDELILNANRIMTRCSSVNVNVNTPRDEHQDHALQLVNEVISTALKNDNLKTKVKIQGFLNACMPEENGHIDDKFQSLIIACTADDQKRIRRRLVKIIEQIDQTQQFSSTNQNE